MTDHTSAVERLPSDEQFRLQCGELTAQGLRDAKAGYRMALAAIKQDSEAGAVAWRVTGDVFVSVTCEPATAEQCRRDGYNVTPLYTRPAAALPEVDEAMVTTAARALCKRNSEMCGVDNEDNWKLYADDFKTDAFAALTAALRPETQG